MRMYPKDRTGYIVGVNKALFNPSGENTYDVRGEQTVYNIGGWFDPAWFEEGWFGTTDDERD